MNQLQLSSIYHFFNGKDTFTAKFLGYLPNAASNYLALFSICMDGEDIVIDMEDMNGWHLHLVS